MIKLLATGPIVTNRDELINRIANTLNEMSNDELAKLIDFAIDAPSMTLARLVGSDNPDSDISDSEWLSNPSARELWNNEPVSYRGEWLYEWNRSPRDRFMKSRSWLKDSITPVIIKGLFLDGMDDIPAEILDSVVLRLQQIIETEFEEQESAEQKVADGIVLEWYLGKISTETFHRWLTELKVPLEKDPLPSNISEMEDFYAIEDHGGEKYIHINGYFYDNGEDGENQILGLSPVLHIRHVQYSGFLLSLEEFLSPDFDYNTYQDNCKQYIEDIDEEERMILMNHYFGMDIPITSLDKSGLSMDTPCGFYVGTLQ